MLICIPSDLKGSQEEGQAWRIPETTNLIYRDTGVAYVKTF